MTVPDLPLDVIYVVACHLAGSFAFGTLAALHLASRHVAETIVPVLYETVLADNMDRLPPETNERYDAGEHPFRYTK